MSVNELENRCGLGLLDHSTALALDALRSTPFVCGCGRSTIDVLEHSAYRQSSGGLPFLATQLVSASQHAWQLVSFLHMFDGKALAVFASFSCLESCL